MALLLYFCRNRNASYTTVPLVNCYTKRNFLKANRIHMKWSELFTSSVGKKIVMSITGLFLISFLVVHAGVNACIFADLSIFDSADDGLMFNRAAAFMGGTVLIRIMEY